MANQTLVSSLLTDRKVNTAKPKNNEYTLRDGNCLSLVVRVNGSKLWKIRANKNGISINTTIGNYPTVTLKDARLKRDEYLSSLAQGINPLEEKAKQEEQKILEAKSQFHLVVKEWIYDRLECSQSHKDRKYRNFERDLFPYFCKFDKNHDIISSINIKEISHSKLLEVLRIKEKTAIESANRLLSDCKALWVYAYECNYTDEPISLKISNNALKKAEKRHYPKITDLKILKELLLSIEEYKGRNPITALMLQFVVLVPLRPENLCNLEWKQIDFKKKLLTIPRENMKVKDKNLPGFRLPLANQTIDILKEAHRLTSWGKWVFHGLKDIHSPINKETGNKALRSLGFNDEVNNKKQTLHSFRGTFRSLAETYQNEHNASFEVKERILDHHERNEVVRAYGHKADYTEQMRPLLQWWSDFLDKLKALHQQ